MLEGITTESAVPAAAQQKGNHGVRCETDKEMKMGTLKIYDKELTGYIRQYLIETTTCVDIQKSQLEYVPIEAIWEVFAIVK